MKLHLPGDSLHQEHWKIQGNAETAVILHQDAEDPAQHHLSGGDVTAVWSLHTVEEDPVVHPAGEGQAHHLAGEGPVHHLADEGPALHRPLEKGWTVVRPHKGEREYLLLPQDKEER